MVEKPVDEAVKTRLDVQWMLEHYPEWMKERLSGWIRGRFFWVTTATLADGEAGVTDDTHRAVEESRDGAPVGVQQELREDIHCQLYQVFGVDGTRGTDEDRAAALAEAQTMIG